jgi:hypothetical protein
MNDKGCSLACTGTFCWIWFWRSIEVFFLAVAAVLLYFFFIIDCITEDSFEIINGNNTIIVIRECANWRQLEAILAISTTIGAAASLALLGVLRHTTRQNVQDAIQELKEDLSIVWAVLRCGKSEPPQERFVVIDTKARRDMVSHEQPG